MDSVDSLTEKIRIELKEKFSLTDEELNAALDNGSLVFTDSEVCQRNDVIVETPFRFRGYDDAPHTK